MAEQVSITVLSGVCAGDVFRFDLDVGEGATIGRAQTCDLVLQDPAVSREHVKIELRRSGFYITDLGSSHGTVHMGFPISPGIDGRRQLNDCDEFKIGESIFRVNFELTKAVLEELESSDTSSPPKNRKGFFPKNKKEWRSPKGLAIIGIVLILLVFLLLPSGKKGNGLPRQLSNKVMNMPQMRVIGYLTAGKASTEKDKSHLDKAQFYLPASDLLIEYDYRSETDVEVYIDKSFVESVGPYTQGWQHRQILVRDILYGEERKLIFDNKDYPRKPGVKGKLKRWAVRDVRVTPLTIPSEIDFTNSVERVASYAVALDKSPESLFQIIRSTQFAIIKALHELSFDAIGFAILSESPSPQSQELVEKIREIKKERNSALVASDVTIRQLNALVETTGQLEAELWRRLNSRLINAQSAAKVKNYIDAHDSLLAAMKMFPEEDDYRWIMARRLFDNKKIVSKKVKARPEKYRRRTK